MSGSGAEILQRFEQALEPARPERLADRFRVVAYGEISTVLRLAEWDGVVLKRMSGFATRAEVDAYVRLVEEYTRGLAERGIRVAPTQTIPIATARNGPVVYLVQPELPERQLGHHVLRSGKEAEITDLLLSVYRTLRVAYARNRDGVDPALALDAQLSNWAFDAGAGPTERLTYFDVGTPLLRRGGRDQLDLALVARPLPQPVRWAIVRFVAPGVFDRYFDLRQVIQDLLANFVKEGREDLLDTAVSLTNAWLRAEARDAGLAPFEVAAIRAYYAWDARLWELASASRRVARFVNVRLLGRPYNFLIPGPVRRR